MKKFAAVVINFDSINEALGFVNPGTDPAFTVASKRMMSLADKYGFKYSIYVIGKDLLSAANRNRVKKWAESGHEIGNHSWSHYNNLGSLSSKEIYAEIKRAHDIIYKAIGKPPRGFIAPGWATSDNMLRELSKLKYKYDTSTFPSWVMFPMLCKLLINRWDQQRKWRVLDRSDFLINLFGPRRRFQKHGVTIFPHPVNAIRLPCLHTLGFVLGWKFQEYTLKSCLAELDDFYYMFHPADFLDKRDIPGGRQLILERLTVPLEEKLRLAEKAVRSIIDSGRSIVTMERLLQERIKG